MKENITFNSKNKEEEKPKPTWFKKAVLGAVGLGTVGGSIGGYELGKHNKDKVNQDNVRLAEENKQKDEQMADFMKEFNNLKEDKDSIENVNDNLTKENQEFKNKESRIITNKEEMDRLEKLEQNLNQYVKERISTWYRDENGEVDSPLVNSLNYRMTEIPLNDIDYSKKFSKDGDYDDKEDPNFGRYTINPEREGLSYIENNEIPKVKFINLKDKKYEGKKVYEIVESIVKEYSGKYRIADLQDQQYIKNLPLTMVPKEFMVPNTQFFFVGSIISLSGSPIVSCLRWDDRGDQFGKVYGTNLSRSFIPSINKHVVLIEK